MNGTIKINGKIIPIEDIKFTYNDEGVRIIINSGDIVIDTPTTIRFLDGRMAFIPLVRELPKADRLVYDKRYDELGVDPSLL